MQKRILLIDDDPDEIDIFIDALRADGFDFKYSTALSTMQAIQMLADLVPDYIVLDYNMPKLNGIECLVKIKDRSYLTHIPVIMYSSTMDEDAMATAMALGAVGCVKKPFDMRTLPLLLKPFF